MTEKATEMSQQIKKVKLVPSKKTGGQLPEELSTACIEATSQSPCQSERPRSKSTTVMPDLKRKVATLHCDLLPRSDLNVATQAYSLSMAYESLKQLVLLVFY